jgi:hypothetical protein
LHQSARSTITRAMSKTGCDFELAKGTAIIKTAKLIGLDIGTVHKLRRELAATP